MHSAPAVEYPVGRSSSHGIMAALACGLAIAVNALWLHASDLSDWRPWLGFVASGLVAVLSYRGWRRSSHGVLGWDGRGWWWESHGLRISGAAAPLLDFQTVLLLGFRARSGKYHWLWLERSAVPSLWSALRRAALASTPDQGRDAKALLAAGPRRDQNKV